MLNDNWIQRGPLYGTIQGPLNRNEISLRFVMLEILKEVVFVGNITQSTNGRTRLIEKTKRK